MHILLLLFFVLDMFVHNIIHIHYTWKHSLRHIIWGLFPWFHVRVLRRVVNPCLTTSRPVIFFMTHLRQNFRKVYFMVTPVLHAHLCFQREKNIINETMYPCILLILTYTFNLISAELSCKCYLLLTAAFYSCIVQLLWSEAALMKNDM